jgi:NAD(P)-dependent dehydrogenase (short-subunit alcohol dehydrogenase family)
VAGPRFDEQTLLVTGGAIAEAFGRAGARVALNDRDPDWVDAACARLAAEEISCSGHPPDVRDAAAVPAMVDGVVAAVGAPAVAVANAGVYPTTPFLDLSPEEWDLVLDANLKGVLLTCQAAARAMTAAGRGGSIITIAAAAAAAAAAIPG